MVNDDLHFQMAPKIPHRDISPALQLLRTFLLGRSANNPLRFADQCSVRDGPPPEVPGGPQHKLSSNYYFTRDARREVMPDKVLADHTKALLGAGKEGPAAVGLPTPKIKTPGQVYLR